DRGGQIRTLEMLKRMHRRHEIHYVALTMGDVSRSSEYCSRAYAIEHRVPAKNTPQFAVQVAKGFFSRLPVVVSRYRSEAMEHKIESLSKQEKFDATVCDFLSQAANMPDLSACVLFQHNVEAVIWRRHAENGPTAAHRWFFGRQANKMS